MPIATPQGTLDFKSVDKVTFVGASSNTVIDTTTGSLGVGVGVGGPTSNLHVVGNAYVSSNLTVSGNVEVGTSNLFVDTVNSRVGVGTDNPQTLLEIVKAGDPTLRIRDSDIDGKARIQLLETGGYTDGIPRYGNEISYDGDNNKFHISTYDGSTTKRDDLTIVRSTGNAGIGTSSPGKKLHVYTTSSESNSQLYLESADRYATMQMKDNSGGVMVQNDQGDLRLLTGYDASMAGGGEVMRIKDTGNVGIGRTSPATALDVNGIIKQTGANWALTNGSVSYSQYRGAYPGDYAYFNRTLSTPTNVTLTHENQGGHNTRSRITIGTTGKYAMYVNGFRQTGTTGTKELQLHKNGSYVSVRAYSGDEGTSNYMTVGGSYTIMDLNANDYVEVKINHCTFHGNDSLYFIGHLVA